MLEHHADAQAAGLGRIAQGDALALPVHVPRVGVGDPVDDLHQGTFAGAIFTEQGVDFSGFNAQVNAIVGQAAGVSLADAVQLQAWRCSGDRDGVWHHRLGSLNEMPVTKQFPGH